MTPEDNFKDSSVVRDQLKSQSVKKTTTVYHKEIVLLQAMTVKLTLNNS